MEITVHLAVAGDVFDGVFLCCPFFPRDVLDSIWGLIESVSEGFTTYFFNLRAIEFSLFFFVQLKSFMLCFYSLFLYMGGGILMQLHSSFE